MKREMARSGTGRDGSRRRIVGDERTIGGIEFIDHDFVETEVAREREPIRRIGCDKMPVRPLLALFVHAGTAVLDEGGRRVQTSVRLDGQRLDAATAIVRHQKRLAGFIDSDMARTVTAGGLLVKKSEFTRIRIDDESAHGPALFTGEIAGFIRRIKKPLVWMNGEETRADRFGGQLRSAQPAADRIEAGDINPFALPAGVSAEVNEEFFRVARRRCRFGVLKRETAKKAGERERNYCSDRETGYPNSESGFPLTPPLSLRGTSGERAGERGSFHRIVALF